MPAPDAEIVPVPPPETRVERRVGAIHLRSDLPYPMPQKARASVWGDAVTVSIPDSTDRWSLGAWAGALFLVVGILMTFGSRDGGGPWSWAMVVTSAYAILQSLLNRRTWSATAQELRYGVGPLPWFRARGRLTGVKQLELERNWTESHDRARPYVFIWELYARTAKNEKVALLEGMRDPVVTHWVAQQLAKKLGVPLVPPRPPPDPFGDPA